METDIYQQNDYRDSIRLRIKQIQKKRPGFTLKKIAQRIPIQYTYLSKAMNDEKTHLNEDHLYILCSELKFQPEERDFIILQRAYSGAQGVERKKDLLKKIERKKTERNLNAEVQNFSTNRIYDDIGYLLNPLCTLVHAALDIEAVRKNPRILCSSLGLQPDELKEVLKKLAQSEYIEFAEDGYQVKALLKDHVHFGRDHPLMRVHQNLLKTLIHSKVIRCSEESKISFMGSMTMDSHAYERVREEFQKFLKAIEPIVRGAKSKHLYQLNFDFFRWL